MWNSYKCHFSFMTSSRSKRLGPRGCPWRESRGRAGWVIWLRPVGVHGPILSVLARRILARDLVLRLCKFMLDGQSCEVRILFVPGISPRKRRLGPQHSPYGSQQRWRLTKYAVNFLNFPAQSTHKKASANSGGFSVLDVSFSHHMKRAP